MFGMLNAISLGKIEQSSLKNQKWKTEKRRAWVFSALIRKRTCLYAFKVLNSLLISSLKI